MGGASTYKPSNLGNSLAMLSGFGGLAVRVKTPNVIDEDFNRLDKKFLLTKR